MLRGEYTIGQQGQWCRLGNNMPDEGKEVLMQILFQNLNVTKMYIGLTGMSGTATTLSGITDEPLASEGYARVEVTLNSTGFPTIALNNNVVTVTSKEVSFTPTTTGFTQKILRSFLATSLDNSGKLVSLSSPLSSELEVTKLKPANVFYSIVIG